MRVHDITNIFFFVSHIAICDIVLKMDEGRIRNHLLVFPGLLLFQILKGVVQPTQPCASAQQNSSGRTQFQLFDYHHSGR